MRLTVEQAVSDRPVAEGDELRFTNKESLPFMRQARRGLNAVCRERPDPLVSDGAGTFLVLWTSDTLPQDCVWEVEARIAGAGSGGRKAIYHLIQAALSTGGVVAALGGTVVVNSQETAAACDARITVDAVNRVVTVDARDDATVSMHWTVVVDTTEGLPEP